MSGRGAGRALSRRDFLRVGSGLTFFVALEAAGCRNVGDPSAAGNVRAGEPPEAPDPEATGYREANKTPFGAWVRIGADDSIVIYNPAAEMGQGSMTSLPLILAEEMDADWAKVRVEHSPVDVEVYGRRWGRVGPGTMLTVGSYAVRGYFMKLRLAGAAIRKALLDLAASALEVPVEELRTEPSVVVHGKSDRRITYGELAAASNEAVGVPEVRERDLKDPADFRLIGHDVERTEIPAKTDGSAMFAIDVKVPGMLYAQMLRSPVHGGRPGSHNQAEVSALPGIEATVVLEHGVAVVGASMKAVLDARKQLRVDWTHDAASEAFDSEAALASYPSIIDRDEVKAQGLSSAGKGLRGLKRANKRLTADYFSDFAYHAQMEPLNAVVAVDEDSAEVWVGTQGPGGVQDAVADALGLEPDRVKVNRYFLGGGFGRRSRRGYVVEAAEISRSVKRPVKLIWTREDDLRYGMFRPMNLQRMQAGLNREGRLETWGHCVVGHGGRLLSSGIEIPFYAVPHQQIEMRGIEYSVRVAHLRSVGHAFNKYAIEAFIDEIAAEVGRDPVDYRRSLMKDSPRALAVLDKVAAMSAWGTPTASGRARGVSVAERSGSIAAAVAEVSVDDEGKIRVHQYWCAVDAGIIVHPANARAQIEGGIVMGLSMALQERITFKQGRVVQSNYHDYPIMRMADAPKVEVEFVPSTEEPTGLGETGGPPTAAAVANAFAALTGKRLRHMPFTHARVNEVLGRAFG